MFERILVPLDGSQLGELAIPYAEALSTRLQSRLFLVKILEPLETDYRHPFEIYLEKISAGIADRAREERFKVPDIVCQVTEGHPVSGINDFAEKNRIGLIIMTSHGKSGLMPWAMGGVAAKVVRGSQVSVLLVRITDRIKLNPHENLFERILLPLDGSINSEVVIPCIKELAASIPLNITLLQVVSSEKHLHNIGGLDYLQIPERLTEKFKLEATKYLEKIQSMFAGTQVVVNFEVRLGNPALEIVKLCDEENIRLIAMSDHGHSAVEKWTIGSISDKIVHISKVPILLVKSYSNSKK
jgi:nucleotide-binding universal stress UspA family protein